MFFAVSDEEHEDRTQSFISAYHNPQDILRYESMANIQISPMPIAEEIGDNNDLTDFQQRVLSFRRFIGNYKTHIFWTALYQLVVGLIFAERAYCKYTSPGLCLIRSGVGSFLAERRRGEKARTLFHVERRCLIAVLHLGKKV